MTGNDTESEHDNGLENNDAGGEVTALHDLIAGGVAGSASVIVGHPFDTIKVRLQTSIASSSPSSSASASPRKDASRNSFRSLFRGMAAPLSTAAVVNAIIFGAYGSLTRAWETLLEDGHRDESSGGLNGSTMGEGHGIRDQTKDWGKKIDVAGDPSFRRIDSESPPTSGRQQWEAEPQATKQLGKQPPESSSAASAGSQNGHQNTLKIFMCGSAAGTVQAFLICPMEHIKCRLQVQQSPIIGPKSSTQQRLYKGPVDACVSIVRNHGLFNGLYRGMCVTLWRETPAFGMYFATYDAVKECVRGALDDNGVRGGAWAASALAGGISGAATWAIIYPFDVVKSRIQTGPLEGPRRGMVKVAEDIVREHGWRHMFRGLGVTLARAFPVNAIIFPVYEFVLVQLGDGG